MTDISVVIVNYRSYHLLKNCIQSIIKHTAPAIMFEVIVVDNSPDFSCRDITIDFPGTQYICNASNNGFAAANNIGLNRSKGAFVCFLNPDTYLLNDALSIFFSFMNGSAGTTAGCCGGALFDPQGNGRVAYGNFPSLFEAFSAIGFYKLYPRYFNKRIRSAVINSGHDIKKVDYISGANLFIRKSALFDTGCFDENFFLYYEETELCFRLKKKGYESVLLPEARIVHIESASIIAGDKTGREKESLLMRSRDLFFRKCYGVSAMAAMQLCYRLKRLLYFIFAGWGGSGKMPGSRFYNV